MRRIPQALDAKQAGNPSFPSSLPEFQRLFPDDAACAAYLEQIRWEQGFECPHCEAAGEPYRFATRPGVLRCRACRRDVALTAGTVMHRTHTPLATWFWGAYLVSSITPGISAVQFQRQLGLRRYETAFQILHKLRAGMVHADRSRIGGLRPTSHVEVNETWIGGSGDEHRFNGQTLVLAAVEVCQHGAGESSSAVHRGDRYAGRLRLAVVPNRSKSALCSFVEESVEPGSTVVTHACREYETLSGQGYQHVAISKGGKSEAAEDYLSMVRLVFLNLRSWLRGTHHGVSPQHLQAYLNEFSFRFNHRFYPFSAFRSLLGLASDGEAPTYAELYSGGWKHAPTANFTPPGSPRHPT